MAIYHCSVKIISRNQGRSSVGAAAYRSGEKLYNSYDGITHDYTRKSGVVYNEIMLPGNAPAEYMDRQTLWNAVEKSEMRTNSRTAREIEVALPVELKREEQIKLLREYIKTNFVEKGMCADFSIHSGEHQHDKDKEFSESDKDIKTENPHAHIMVTVREVNRDGFKNKNRGWDKKDHLIGWRKQWADRCNQEFERKGIPERIDHRSYKDQGIEKEPTIHLGAAAQMEAKGIKTDRGRINEEARATNMEYQKGISEIEKEVEELKLEKQRRQQPQEQLESRSLFNGAVRNPDRNDERETRNWQRSGGLERVEPVHAKEEEFTIKPKLKETEPPDQRELAIADRQQQHAPDISQERSVEEVTQRMTELKSDFLKINKEVQRRAELSGKIRENTQALAFKAERVKESASNIQSIENKLLQLQEQKQSLGIFQGKEKKTLDSTIQSLENSKQQAINAHRKLYDCEPIKAPEKAKEYLSQAKELEKQMPNQAVTEQLKKQQQEIAMAYKAEKVMAEQRPDREQISQMMRQRSSQERVGMQDRMAASQLDQPINKSDLEKIKKTFPDSADIQEAVKKKESVTKEQMQRHDGREGR